MFSGRGGVADESITAPAKIIASLQAIAHKRISKVRIMTMKANLLKAKCQLLKDNLQCNPQKAERR
jgi:hypothetical protein